MPPLPVAPPLPIVLKCCWPWPRTRSRRVFYFSALTSLLLTITSSAMIDATVTERLEYMSLSLAMAEARKAMVSIVSDSLLFVSARELADARFLIPFLKLL